MTGVVAVAAGLDPSGVEVAAVVGVVVLLGLGALLATAEAALTSMPATRAARLAEGDRPAAATLHRLAQQPELWRSPLLLSVVGCQLAEATVVGALALRWGGGVGLAAAIVVNIAVVFVVVTVVPRTLARARTERLALAAARPVALLVAFPPLRALSRGLIALANLLVPGKGPRDEPWVSEEELLALAEAAVEGEVLEEDERALIASILEFGDTIVREVMVPRPDMVTVPAAFRVGDVMEVAILNGLSRLPATGEGIDDVVGIVYAKDLMRAERDGEEGRPVAELLRSARFIPETKRISELLREMQAEQYHMAVAVDEYGGTAGLVTLEDLIEELVGEIVDEYDREEPMVEPAPDGRVRVNGRLGVDELGEVLGADLPEGDWDTVGGLLFHLLGHIPVEGEWVASEGWVLTAERVQGRRVQRVSVQPASSPLPWATDGEGDPAADDGAEAARGGAAVEADGSPR